MKIALFSFKGDFMCFIHVLLNALDMHEKCYDVKVIIEGSATGLIPEIAKAGNPMYALYEKTKALDLIAGACKACSNKMGTLEAAKAEGIKLLDDIGGHPSMAEYLGKGCQVITF